jgi:hypothetical protein
MKIKQKIETILIKSGAGLTQTFGQYGGGLLRSRTVTTHSYFCTSLKIPLQCYHTTTALCVAGHSVAGYQRSISRSSSTLVSYNELSKAENLKFYSWFAGFCDAEGNFQTTTIKRINKKGVLTSIGLKYSFHMGLHLRDKALLELIQVKLNNMGKIYEYKTKEEAHLAIYKVEDLR